MKRSKFNLSHYKLLTMNMGELIPLTWYEAIPGDTIQQSTSCLIRVQPLLAPLMHPVRVRIHHWFVPNRHLWDSWEDFITGGPDGTSTPAIPQRSRSSTTESSLYDYMDLPASTYGAAVGISVLPFRAYAQIFNEHYRDQDLVSELACLTTNGTDSTTNTSIANVSWEKDYFTTARDSEQKGDEVTIPLLGDAPITGLGVGSQTATSGPKTVYETDQASSSSFADYWRGDAADPNTIIMEEDPDNAGFPNARANLAAASGVSINDLRLALAVQRYQEARAQYGSRYVEYLRYLGVRSSDQRLQNPEYLGGGRQTIQFSEVLSTDGSNTGDMKGHGIAAMRTNRYRRFIEEHGIIMTLMSVVPKAIYAEGIPRKFRRTSKEDYFQKELQFIGEQEIPNHEVQAEHTSNTDIFGYQNRYDEYRTGQHGSGIAGEFNSTLNHWHMARQYSGDVSLNSSWVTCSPTTRVYAAPSSHQLYVMAHHSIQARRPIAARAKSKII